MTDEPPVALPEDTTDAAAVAGAPNPRKPLPLRTKLLFAMLAAICAAFAVNTGHVNMLESELETIAAEKERDQQEHFGQFSSGIETVSTVTATKENLFFGDVSGKIEVFVRNVNSSGPMQGFDYFLSRDNAGVWIVRETGTCVDEACQRRGAEAFARLE